MQPYCFLRAGAMLKGRGRICHLLAPQGKSTIHIILSRTIIHSAREAAIIL